MSRRYGGRLLAAAGALVVLLTTAVPALAVAPAPAVAPTLAGAPTPDDAGRLILLLDSSGSMKEKDKAGKPKIDGAKQALTELIPSLEPRALVGLRVYGATVPSKNREAACRDTQLAVPLGAGNRDQLVAAVNAVKPLGETPIAYTLRQALKDLGPTGARSIVLVSDGEESCVPDACPTAREVASGGVDLKIDVIGLGVDGKTRKQLQCIATAGRGRYYDAQDATQLALTLRTASVRASRAFSFNGTQVEGAATAAAKSPTIAPGLYSDRLGSKRSERFYTLATKAGATYHLSAALRPTPASYAAQDGFRLRVLTQDGQVCRESAVQRVSPGRIDGLMIASLPLPVSADPRDAAKPCGKAGTVRVVVARDTAQASTTSGDTPFELLVIEEPPVASSAGLPPGQKDPAPTPVRAGATEKETTGGSSLSLAATLTNGSWRDTIKPGETLVYRVRTQWGQRAVMTLDALDGDEFVRKVAAGTNSVPIDVRVLSSGRSEQEAARVSGRYRGEGFSLTTAGATARYLNRQVSSDGADDLAGYQYFVVQAGASTSDYVVPLRLNVAVTGARSGDPAFDALAGSPKTATPTATPAPQAVGDTVSSGGSGQTLLIVGLGLVGVAALALVAVRVLRLDLLFRRRRL